jgi:hypothetical protein
MPRGRPSQGPKLVALQKKGCTAPVFYIRWFEAGRSYERSTGTGDRKVAEEIFGRWLVERGNAAAANRGPAYPGEATIEDLLAWQNQVERRPEGAPAKTTTPRPAQQCTPAKPAGLAAIEPIPARRRSPICSLSMPSGGHRT